MSQENDDAKMAELLKTRLEAVLDKLNFHKGEVLTLTKQARTLDDTYRMLTNQSLMGVTDKPMVDYVEDLLREHKEGLHVDAIVALLKEQFQVVSGRQTVAAALIRAHNLGKRFVRVGKNTFALREQGGNMK